MCIQKVTANNEPCFHVWDTSDTYYEFGCTTDSLQYRYASNTLSLYQWDLNEMVAPNDGSTSTFKNIVVKYFQDCGTSSGNCPQASSASGSDAIRDAAIEQIQYGIGSQPGTVSTASGTVDFSYWAPNAPSGSQWAIPYTDSFNGTSYACDGNPPEDTHNMRCDDPQPDSDDPGSAPPPTVMSTLTLLSVTSYVGNDSGTGSFPAYQYQFTYTDTPLSECVDPLSQVQETCAGDHILDTITPFVYKHGTANQLQPLLLKYTSAEDGYYDTTQTVPGGNHYTIDTSWLYLSDEYDSNTGVGEHIDYSTAYNNSHGTPYDTNTGDNRLDPLFCSTHLGGPFDCSTYDKQEFAYPDDRAWTTQVVIDRKSFGVDSSAMSQAVTTYAYVLKITTKNDPSMCPDDGTGDTNCPGDNWWPQGDSDWQDYYHGQFQGFNTVETVSPSSDLTQDTYFSTDGWDSPSSYPNNAFAGDLTEEDVYQGNQTSDPLLSDLTNNYGGLNKTNTPCDAAIGNPYDPCEPIIYSSVATTYNGSASSNPPSETTSSYYDDYNPQPSQPPSSWSLTINGNYHHLLEETTTGSNTNENSASNLITKLWTYTTTDSGYNPSGWYFYDVNKIAHSEIDDVGNPMRKWDCQAFTYDEGSGSQTPEAGWPTTASTYTSANCNPGNFTTPFTTSYTGYDALGNAVATVDPLAQANQSFYGGTGISGKNGCSLTTAPAILSTSWSKSRYTTCLTYDPTYNALPTSTTNAFSQTASTSYDAQMGELPKAVTDPNTQATSYSYSYDSSGNRTVQVSEPNETQYAYTSQSATSSGCAGSIPTGAIMPCFAIDSNEAEYPTAITETFYDGLGRQVETRAPGPTSGDDTIQFTVYNDSAHTSFTSVPFEVTAGNGWLDPATAKDKNGHTPAGTMTYEDALGRLIAVDDPLFNPPSVPSINCPSIGTAATACTVYKLDSPAGSSTLYDTEKDIDPNNHVMEAFTDAMGRVADTQEYSGTNGNGLSANQQISYQYDALDDPTQVTTIDLAPQNGQSVSSVTTTLSYDDLGRLIQLVDPDRGTHNYTYDPDGNVLTDTSGNRTIGYNDDLLGRIGCVQDGTAVSDADGSCTSGTNPLVQNTYDITEIGTQGVNDFPIGRLTKSQSYTSYPEGGSSISTKKYQYDQRGRVTTEQLKLNLPNSWNLTLPTYQLTEQYTDADQPQQTQTSTINGQGQNTPQYTETQVYDSTLGVLTGLGNTSSFTNANVTTLTYNVNALPSKLSFPTSTGGNLAYEQFSYDGDLRPAEEAATWQNGSGQSGTFFDNAQGYDPASNVDTVTTTISKPNGQSGSFSETQNFCYDEQNRLVWAGNSGTQPSPGNGTCGSGTLANSFPGASYATAFSYTNLDQLWQGPLNGTGSSEQYLYCNSQPHQVSDIVPAGQGYSCSNLPSSIPYAVTYDAWGNVTSRSYNTQTATLSYNKLDEMVEWQVPNTNQAWYAYDASGERTLERSTTGSTTTETVYAFGLEEYSYESSGNQTSSTHYYSLAGHLIGEVQTTNFFLTDALGSVLAVISNTESNAALLSNQVFAPYGKPLSQNGNTFSQYTNKGFTGQYNDPTSGLDYYVSRYYDAVSGVFLSADKTLGDATGMNPYSYVGNNPETNNDPTGQAYIPPGGGGGGGSGGNGNSNGNGGGSGGGGAGYGGGNGNGMGDPGSGGHEGGGCAWWNPSCEVQQIWHTVVNGAQTAEHDVSNGIHFLQQQEQELIQDGVKLGIKIIVALVAAAIAFGSFLFGLIRSGGARGGWTEGQQRQVAFRLGNEIDQYRTGGSHDQHGPYAKGCIGVGGDTSCSNSSSTVLGFGKNSNMNHAEAQIYYWALGQIQKNYQNLPKGSVINILIYVQMKPCDYAAYSCQRDIPLWAKALQAAAPPGVIVRLWIWYQPGFDKDNPFGNLIVSPGQVAPFKY